MWAMLAGPSVCDLNGQENAEDVAAEEEVAPEQTSERPESWIFRGRIAYQLVSPRAHVDFQSPHFSFGDWMKNKRGSDDGG